MDVTIIRGDYQTKLRNPAQKNAPVALQLLYGERTMDD